MFKKPSKFAKADEDTQVQSTLLEYGQRFVFTGSKANKEETGAKQKTIAAGLKITFSSSQYLTVPAIFVSICV